MEHDNKIPEGLTPYRIATTETFEREVEIFAEDSFSAEEMAEELCNNGDIDLDGKDFVARNMECLGVARSIDLEQHQVFGLEQTKTFAEEHPIRESDETIRNLISAMTAYGLEHSLCDSDIIESLISLGITYEDFCEAGAQDFVKDYFEAPSEQKPSLNDLMAGAAAKAEQLSGSCERTGFEGPCGR